mmetsp:Transcript_18791/g.33731  ORF Transcript_18791/g.33731 Transcript_18791/m.33731 type:complete len:214 (-) Transcript_18791:435-1076(-)
MPLARSWRDCNSPPQRPRPSRTPRREASIRRGCAKTTVAMMRTTTTMTTPSYHPPHPRLHTPTVPAESEWPSTPPSKAASKILPRRALPQLLLLQPIQPSILLLLVVVVGVDRGTSSVVAASPHERTRREIRQIPVRAHGVHLRARQHHFPHRRFRRVRIPSRPSRRGRVVRGIVLVVARAKNAYPRSHHRRADALTSPLRRRRRRRLAIAAR